jgi:tripartite-type tricarboxylate transporter receptor subunit TctC
MSTFRKQRNPFLKPVTTLLVILGLLMGGLSHANNEEVAAFYRGKTITAYAGSAPGGGIDFFTRLVAKYIGKYIPGEPTVTVDFMPGAGTIVLSNYLYSTAPADGTQFGLVSQNIGFSQLLRDPGVRYEATEFTYLGAVFEEPNLCVAQAAMAREGRTVFQAPEVPVIIGATGRGSATYISAALAKELLGLRNAPIIPGYPGTSDLFLALERREIDAACVTIGTVLSNFGHLLESGVLVPVMIAGVSRSPLLPDVPTWLELVGEGSPNYQLLQAASLPTIMGRPFIAPPGVPAARAEALQNAFIQALRDPGLLAEAAQAGIEIDPKTGADVQAIIATMFALSAEDVDRLNTILD